MQIKLFSFEINDNERGRETQIEIEQEREREREREKMGGIPNRLLPFPHEVYTLSPPCHTRLVSAFVSRLVRGMSPNH